MRLRDLLLTVAAAVAFLTPGAHAQTAQPTANKRFEISGFGGINGSYTGLAGGKNLGITAGLDVGVRSYDGFRPYLEGRGMYAIDGGHIDREKNALGGVRVERTLLPKVRVYGDFLLGRGKIDYENGGYLEPGGAFRVVSSTSTVYSPGGGAEYQLTDHFSALVDAQFQHYSTPATLSGGIWSKPILFGVRYRIDFNRHGYPVAP